MLSSLILYNNEPFFDQIVTCYKKWILHNNQQWPVQWVDQEGIPKHLLKPNLYQIKGHGHCLVVWCWSDPLQLSESWRNHYIREVWSANRSDTPKTAMPAASTGQQKRPNSSPQHPTAGHTSNTSKVEQIGLWGFVSSAAFIWHLTNWPPLLQASQQFFFQGKCFPRVHQILKDGFLCYRNKQTYFSLEKVCWLWWFLFWLIKMYLSLATMT